MAGKNAGFDAARFRSAIRFVYDMAAVPAAADQVYFHFDSRLVYNRPGNEVDIPFDPSATVTRVPVPPIQVPCGVQYFDGQDQDTAFGDVVPARVELTLLDEDYQKVQNSDFVVIKGEKFRYSHTKSPSGLFDVGLYTMTFTATNAR